MRRIAFLVAVVAMALAVAAAPVAATTIVTHSPSSDVVFEDDGDSYEFTVSNPTGTNYLDEVEFDAEVERDSSGVVEFAVLVDGRQVDTASRTFLDGGTSETTFEFEDVNATVEGSTTDIELVLIDGESDANTTFRTSDEARLYFEELNTDLTNPQDSEEATTPPTDLSADATFEQEFDEVDVVFYDSDDEVIGTETLTEDGTATVSYDWDRDDVNESGFIEWTAEIPGSRVASAFEAETSPPELTNPSPDEEEITTTPVTLEVDVDDPDFETELGDRVELTWTHNDEVVDTTTLNEAATVSTTVSPEPGTNTWNVTAEDDYGNEVQLDAQFSTPSEISIRPVDDPESTIDDAEVTIQIFGSDEVFERSTTNGTVSMEDLPPDEKLVITADSPDYHIRQVIIDSIIDQQNIYLLDDTDQIDIVEPTFDLEDPTGQFTPENSQLFIERPLTIDGETKWVTVAADEFGVSGYTPILQQDQRYRLSIRNNRGDVRTLGSYTASSSELVTLSIEGVEFDFDVDAVEGVEWTASLDTETNVFTFAYFDNDEETDVVTARAYERGNESNVLFEETWAPGNDIQFETEVEENTTTWVLEFEADRDGEIIEQRRLVGPGQILVGTQVDDRWLTVAGAGMLLVVGGLFGAARPEVGAVSVSALGAVLWIIGWLPGTTTGAMVLLAMFISALFYIRSQRGGTP